MRSKKSRGGLALPRNNPLKLVSWRRLQDCLVFLATAALIFILVLKANSLYWGIESVREHPDERWWVHSCYAYTLFFVERDYSNEYWRNFISYEQPPVGKYVFGFTLHIVNDKLIGSSGGLMKWMDRALGYLVTDGLAKKANRSLESDKELLDYGGFLLGQLKPTEVAPVNAEDLLLLRRTSFFFGIMCVALIVVWGSYVFRFPFAWVLAGFFFLDNRVTVPTLQQALPDLVGHFFAILSFIVVFRLFHEIESLGSRRRIAFFTLLEGMLLSFAFGVKFTTAYAVAGVLAVFAAGIIVHAIKTGRGCFGGVALRVIVLAVILSVAFLAFVALNPLLYANPVDNSLKMFNHRFYFLDFQARVQGPTVTALYEKWDALYKMGILRNYDLQGIELTVYLSVFVLGFLNLLRSGFKEMRSGSIGVQAMTLLIISAAFLVNGLMVRLVWDRYYLPFVIGAAVMLASGVETVLCLLARALKYGFGAMKPVVTELNRLASASKQLPYALIILAFAVVFVRTSWICDDAYITLRVVDNFVNGMGLRWNTDERVQAYTNPLWLLLLSVPYYFTREAYPTTLALSAVVSLSAVCIVLFAAASLRSAIVASAMLISSRAFVDYSSSGLENPLTHLLAAAFSVAYFGNEKDPGRKMFTLALLTALAAVNRIDMLVLYIFPLTSELLRGGLRWHVKHLALAAAPLALWLAFSTAYYGFPLPNTAYAKVFGTSIDGWDMAYQGLRYIRYSLDNDLPTIAAILGGFAVALLRGQRFIPLAVGCLAYLSYVIAIGGDFMGGRFLTPPLVLCACMLSKVEYGRRQFGLATASIIVLSLWNPNPTLLSSVDHENYAFIDGIADERGFYSHRAGLMTGNRPGDMQWPGYPLKHNSVVEVAANIGLSGFTSKRDLHIIDTYGLGDPLLARLPADPDSRIGHFKRCVPPGYVRTIASGRNQIHDKEIAQYYDKLSIIIRGRIFDPERLKTIVVMNTGGYDHLISGKTHPEYCSH